MSNLPPDAMAHESGSHDGLGNPERVLLINPPIHDIRFPWAKWQQPTRLLKLSTYFKRQNSEVKFIDNLHDAEAKRLHRERTNFVLLDEFQVARWRYGPSRSSTLNQLKQFKAAKWYPDRVFVDCSTTFWWEGAAESAQLVKEVFPSTSVTLIGDYPALALSHAKSHIEADLFTFESASEVAILSADIKAYAEPPQVCCVSLAEGRRDAEQVIDEIEQAFSYGVRVFALVEHAVASRFPALFRNILERLAERRLAAKFYALGSISPEDFVQQPDLASLMRRASYRQICFSDDRDIDPSDNAACAQRIENYRVAVQRCQDAGFRSHTDDLIASVCIGRSNEGIAERTKHITLASHHVGSVTLWPYQPRLDECPDIPMELQNGRLFPLREQNGLTYRDYLEIMGLGSVLNSKYREHTFDFMGNGFVARLMRDSLEKRAWEAPDEVKGSLRLPMIASR